MNVKLELSPVDIRIWQQELNDYLPERIYDSHFHVYKKSEDLSGSYVDSVMEQFADFSAEDIQKVYGLILPGREVACAVMGFPFIECDFESAEKNVAAIRPFNSANKMYYLINPSMSAERIDQALTSGFAGVKPYRYYSKTGDIVECRITDMLSEEHLEVVDAHKKTIVLHIGKSRAMTDPENYEDIQYLAKKYSGVKFVLAHCARAFTAEYLAPVVDMLAALKNVYVDTSAVCDVATFYTLLDRFPLDRILYGSDATYPGWHHCTMVSFGSSWATLTAANNSFDLSHCEGTWALYAYENLRALVRACKYKQISKAAKEDIFYNNCAGL